MNPATQLPINVRGRLEFEAHDPAALRAGLIATLAALDQGVEPNVLWAPGYRIAIKVGGTS